MKYNGLCCVEMHALTLLINWSSKNGGVGNTSNKWGTAL